MKDFKGKVAVITGGASGIGLGIARALCKAGAHVVIADIAEKRAQQAAGELARQGTRTVACGCDVSDRKAVESLADQAWSEFGHVDLLFNNAGVVSEGGLLIDAKEEDLRWLLEVNIIGVWNGCSVFGKRFREQGSPAHIVNTGSEHSISPAHAFAGFYTATKHAILAFSDILRFELPDFIKVSILCPGVVATDLPLSRENRPERFGGPQRREGVPVANSAGSFGMDPNEVGERTLEGIRRGDFYIVTHPHVREVVEERYKEILTAFEAQAPHYEGDEKYNLRKLIEQAMKKQ